VRQRPIGSPWRNVNADVFLRYIATDDDHFYDEPKSTDLLPIFQAIVLGLLVAARSSSNSTLGGTGRTSRIIRTHARCNPAYGDSTFKRRCPSARTSSAAGRRWPATNASRRPGRGRA